MPSSIVKDINGALSSVYERDYVTFSMPNEKEEVFRSRADRDAYVVKLELEMKKIASNLEFERAAELRDQIKQLKKIELGIEEGES